MSELGAHYEHTLDICKPCRDGHHLECEATEKEPCECLVCEGQRIGDEVNYDLGGNFPRRPKSEVST